MRTFLYIVGGLLLERLSAPALSLFRAQHALIETLGIKLRYFQRDQPSAVLIANSGFARPPSCVTKISMCSVSCARPTGAPAGMAGPT
mgnify:CR=1 FL=1